MPPKLIVVLVFFVTRLLLPGEVIASENVAQSAGYNKLREPKAVLNIETSQSQDQQIQFDFSTEKGKSYQIEYSQDLKNYRTLIEGITGDGGVRNLILRKDGTIEDRGVVSMSYWADVTEGLQELKQLRTFQKTPSGEFSLLGASAPRFLASGYASKMSLSFKAPISGQYQLFLSSNGEAELFLTSNNAFLEKDRVASIGRNQAGIRPKVWKKYSSQASKVLTFKKGQVYTLQALSVSRHSFHHLQVGWLKPNADKVQFIPRSVLYKKLSLTEKIRDEHKKDGSHFYRVKALSQDQDADGVSDFDELKLAQKAPFLFFDSQSFFEVDDADTFDKIESHSSGEKPLYTLLASDTLAYESTFPYNEPDVGKIIIKRSGALLRERVPICFTGMEKTGQTATVCDGACCKVIGSAGDEIAEVTDYQLFDEDGRRVYKSVLFDFQEPQKTLILKATFDHEYEYPETVNIALEESPEHPYIIDSSLNGASIQIFDLPNHAKNRIYFAGKFGKDAKANTATNATGTATMFVNGHRTEIWISDQFSGLTSSQTTSHVHKASIGLLPGDVVYGITQKPAVPSSAPLLGNLQNYKWDLEKSSGAIPTHGGVASRQVILDSLFGQNNETPLYLNVHTKKNPAGEIWAFFHYAEGSVSDPGDASPSALAGSSDFPLLKGELLECEVRRFLNQATFGAYEPDVKMLMNRIQTKRKSEPQYHRVEAFRDWLNTQMNPEETPQTYLLDLALALSFQEYRLNGHKVDQWPSVNRSDGFENWYLSAPYPVSYQTQKQRSILLSSRLADVADYQLKVNGGDQLRQKMGFALQQILVTSNASARIERNAYGSAFYRDSLAQYAFHHYRDVLGYANWSPVMGHWLTSLQNQKAVDFDGDGVFDSFPDENLARENMQLFSIGLFKRWSDGSFVLNELGQPVPSYSNKDIKELAKVFTGQSFSKYASIAQLKNASWGGVPYSASPYKNVKFSRAITVGEWSTVMHQKMKMFGDFHSSGKKTFVGKTIDHSSLSPDKMGINDIESALDWLGGIPNDGKPDYNMKNSHISTPAFISKLLIQRFTTSNPSRGYLHRVASVFKRSEGHLGKTIHAILLDPEARNINLKGEFFGMKKSPLEAYLQLLISLEAHTYIPLTQPKAQEAPYAQTDVNYANPDIYVSNVGYPSSQLKAQRRNIMLRIKSGYQSSTQDLGMTAYRAPSVFNYYLSDYTKYGAISEAGLIAPEMQLANEQTIIKNINYFYYFIYSATGTPGYSYHLDDKTQRVFGDPKKVTNLFNVRLPIDFLAVELYPKKQIPATSLRSSESLADEALVNELDKRLTNGLLKFKYPYNARDDDDSQIAGEDDLLKNPRELIIDALTQGVPDAQDGKNDDADRIKKLKLALYLLVSSPEYQIRK